MCDFRKAPSGTTVASGQEGRGQPDSGSQHFRSGARALPDAWLGVLHLTWRPGLLASSRPPCWAAAHFLSRLRAGPPPLLLSLRPQSPLPPLLGPQAGQDGTPCPLQCCAPSLWPPRVDCTPVSKEAGTSPEGPLTKLRPDDGGHPQPQGRPRAWLAVGSRAAVGAAGGPQLVTKQMFPRQDWLQPMPGWVSV